MSSNDFMVMFFQQAEEQIRDLSRRSEQIWGFYITISLAAFTFLGTFLFREGNGYQSITKWLSNPLTILVAVLLLLLSIMALQDFVWVILFGRVLSLA